MSKYLLRPDDYAVFTQNEDGTFSHDESGQHMPYRYKEAALLTLGFIPKDELNWPEIMEKRDFYTRYMNWYTRSDGHGGSKGGTLEEFLQYERNKH